MAAAAAEPLAHRVGLGWRKALASGILAHRECVDVVEVIAEDLFDANARTLSSMKTLSRQVPLVVHGLSLGLASATPTDSKRLRKLARVLDALCPAFWSEHLAFVRAAGVEIGHLAAAPRAGSTIAGFERNVRVATRVTGAKPLLENIATLIAPPGSTLDEPSFVRAALEAADVDLLLDLHNVYANAQNFGFDAREFVLRMPPERIAAIHLAGGRWVKKEADKPRLVDDHLHAVPDAVYELLALVASRAVRPLTVIIERDGHYPDFSVLLAEVERARTVLRGAAPRASATLPLAARLTATPGASAALEHYLARLYVDETLLRRFLGDRQRALAESGLDHDARAALARVDAAELTFAAESYAHKRAGKRVSGS